VLLQGYHECKYSQHLLSTLICGRDVTGCARSSQLIFQDRVSTPSRAGVFHSNHGTEGHYRRVSNSFGTAGSDAAQRTALLAAYDAASTEDGGVCSACRPSDSTEGVVRTKQSHGHLWWAGHSSGCTSATVTTTACKSSSATAGMGPISRRRAYGAAPQANGCRLERAWQPGRRAEARWDEPVVGRGGKWREAWEASHRRSQKLVSAPPAACDACAIAPRSALVPKPRRHT
jgi:hypothetical protein